jgi:hypothetical protein
LIRLHILHHTVEAPIFGFGKLAELERYGDGISPGTLYPLFHGLEQKAIGAHGRNPTDGRDDAAER